MAVDWLAIRNDYINGGGSYRKLAEKYGVNKDTIAKKAKAEGWISQKDIQTVKLQTEIIQKTQEKIADSKSEEAAAKARIRVKLIQMAERWIDKHFEEPDSMEDTTDYRRIVQSCADMGVFSDDSIKIGEGREDDPLTKALKEEAERMQQNANIE